MARHREPCGCEARIIADIYGRCARGSIDYCLLHNDASKMSAALTKIANDAEYYRSAINDRPEGMSALEDISTLAEETIATHKEVQP